MSPFEAAWVARRLRDPAPSPFGPAQGTPEPVEGAGPRLLVGAAQSSPQAARPGASADRPVAVALAVSEQLGIRSHRATQFVDVTDLVAGLVARHRVAAGHVTVQTLHTTTGIVVNEHEPLLLADFRRTLARVAPRGVRYAHDDFTRRRDIGPGERVNARAHCQALFVPTSATLVVADGRLVLGRWQRVFFVELDGPQARAMCVSVMGVPAE